MKYVQYINEIEPADLWILAHSWALFRTESGNDITGQGHSDEHRVRMAYPSANSECGVAVEKLLSTLPTYMAIGRRILGQILGCKLSWLETFTPSDPRSEAY